MCLAAHNHRTIQRHLAEMLQVGLQSPRQLTIAADDEVVPDRCNQDDFHYDVFPRERTAAPARVVISTENSKGKWAKWQSIVWRSHNHMLRTKVLTFLLTPDLSALNSALLNSALRKIERRAKIPLKIFLARCLQRATTRISLIGE